MEVFKTITEFPDYEVSNFGRIKTRARKIRYTHAQTGKELFRQSQSRFLKVQYNGRTGYKFCQLYKAKKMHNKSIHRLVAIEFVGNPYGLDYVNHIDGNKHNNVFSNLEWCTNEYNHAHATATGLKARGSEIGSSKLTENSAHAVKWFLREGYTHVEIAEAFKLSVGAVSNIARGLAWSHVALCGKELEFK